MTGLVRRVDDAGGELARADQFTREQLDLLKRTVADGKLSDDQFALYMARVRATGLDPFSNQISAQARWNRKQERHDLVIITGIDGFRLIADRTGQRDGEGPTQWCGDDGKWMDLWTSKNKPFAARVVLYRKGCNHPFIGIAKCDAYYASRYSGDWWAKAPDHMLAKCAEALALRKAFPAELSGMYTGDEMGQAKNPAARPVASRPQYETAPVTADEIDAGAAGYDAEPLPTHTSQRVEVAGLLAELKRKRSIEGVDKWVDENGEALQALDPEERKTVIDAYRAKRKAIQQAKTGEGTRKMLDDADAERSSIEKDSQPDNNGPGDVGDYSAANDGDAEAYERFRAEQDQLGNPE